MPFTPIILLHLLAALGALAIGGITLMLKKGTPLHRLAGRLMLWGVGKPPMLRFFLLCLIAIPGARFLGNLLPLGILGIPDEAYDAIWEKNALRIFMLTILICASITWFFWNRGKVAYLIAQAETEKARAAAIAQLALPL